MIFFFRYVDFSTLLKGAIAKFDFFNETEKGLLFSHNYKSLIFFAISISLGIILSAYVIQTYKKNCAKVQLYSEKSKCINSSYKKHEKVSALFRRELKRYFSTPVYLLNTMLGIVSLVLLTLYSYIICLVYFGFSICIANNVDWNFIKESKQNILIMNGRCL